MPDVTEKAKAVEAADVAKVAKVTWLMPVKNGMPYLPDTLASLEAQSFRDFQVFVWDNGSTDGTVEELQKWIPSRLPGRIITGQPRSLGGSLAGLVEMADTDICARIDADDICHPDRLERQMDFLQRNPDVALVGSQMRVIDDTGMLTGTNVSYPLVHEDIVNTMLTSNPIGHPSVAFRKSAILAAGNYNAEAVLEDFDLWLRLARGHKLANLPDCSLDYRMHPMSYSRGIEKAQKSDFYFNQTLVANAPALLGLPGEAADRLRARASGLVLGDAIHIARYLAKTQGGSTWARLRSASLAENLRPFMRDGDLLSRLGLAYLGSGVRPMCREAKEIAKEVIVKKLGGARLLDSMRERRARKRLRNWIAEQNAAGSHISNDVTFIGREEGYTQISNGTDLRIDPDVTIWISDASGSDPRMIFGTGVYIGLKSFVGAYQPITIGDNAMIGGYTYIISANHRFDSREIPIRVQGFTGAPISIGEDVWIGAHCVILPGVTIGKGAIVAAGSVVNRSIPEYEIWGGTPARFIKQRP